MIDFLYSWIRDRRFLDCQDYTRIIDRQRELVIYNKEEYELSPEGKDLKTIIASANLYAHYLFKGSNYQLSIETSNKIMEFCNKIIANHGDIKHQYVNTCFNLGDVYYKIGKAKEARKYYNMIIKFIGDDEKYSATKQGQHDLYDSYISLLAADHLDSDSPDDVELIHNLLMEAHKIALDIVEFYDDEESKRYLMMSYLRLGNFYYNKNSPLQALSLYRQAKDLALEIYQKTNNELDHINLIYCDMAPVTIYYNDKKYDLIMEILDKTCNRLDRMINEHMFLPAVNLQLTALSNKSIVKEEQQNHEEAVKYALCAKLLARLAKNTWDCPEQKIIYAKALMQYGSRIEKENTPKMISDYQKGSDYVEPYINRNDLADASDVYVSANVTLYKKMMEQKLVVEAEKHLLKAINTQEIKISKNLDIVNLRNMCDLYELARNYYFSINNVTQALEYTEKIMLTRKKLLGISRYAFDVYTYSLNLTSIGDMYRLLKEFEISEKYISKAIEIQNRYLRQSPNDVYFLKALANSLNNLILLAQASKQNEMLLTAYVGQKNVFEKLYKITKDEIFKDAMQDIENLISVK